jgi:hypothetical protein
MANRRIRPEQWIMKQFTAISSKLFIIALACAFAASSATAQQVEANSVSSGKPARLIVNRSPDFGVNEVIDLIVDGAKIGSIGYNESFDARLTSGTHVLSIRTHPTRYPQNPPQQLTLTAQSGRTYAFTAVWPDPERAGLVPN